MNDFFLKTVLKISLLVQNRVNLSTDKAIATDKFKTRLNDAFKG